MLWALVLGIRLNCHCRDTSRKPPQTNIILTVESGPCKQDTLVAFYFCIDSVTRLYQRAFITRLVQRWRAECLRDSLDPKTADFCIAFSYKKVRISKSRLSNVIGVRTLRAPSKYAFGAGHAAARNCIDKSPKVVSMERPLVCAVAVSWSVTWFRSRQSTVKH